MSDLFQDIMEILQVHDEFTCHDNVFEEGEKTTKQILNTIADAVETLRPHYLPAYDAALKDIGSMLCTQAEGKREGAQPKYEPLRHIALPVSDTPLIGDIPEPKKQAEGKEEQPKEGYHAVDVEPKEIPKAFPQIPVPEHKPSGLPKDWRNRLINQAEGKEGEKKQKAKLSTGNSAFQPIIHTQEER